MVLDDIALEPASEKEVAEAVKLFTSSRKLNDLGYQLFLGNKFGTDRNYYWLKTNPAGQFEFDFSAIGSNRFVVDYGNNLVHLLGNKIISLHDMVNNPQQIPRTRENNGYFVRRLRHSVQQMKELVDENLRMYGDGKININAEVLGYKNSAIMKDLKYAQIPLNVMSDNRIASDDFQRAAKEFLDFYKKVQSTYAPQTKSST